MISLGSVHSTTFEIKNDAVPSVLTTPASNVCTITLPDGTTTTPTLTVASVGVLRLDYTTVQAGRHEISLQTTTPTRAFTTTFDVDLKASGIVSLADAKRHLNVTSTSNDEEIRDVIDAATEWVEYRVGPVARRTITQTVTPASNMLFLDGPVISLTSMTDAYGYGATYTVGNFTGDASGIVRGTSYASTISYPVTVTYVAGRAIVPGAIRVATLMMVKALWETQRGASALPIIGGEENVEMDNMGMATWRAEKLLAPYMLAPAGA